MPTDGTLECICVERRVGSVQAQRKVCNQTFDIDSSNLAQGDSRDVCRQEVYVFNGMGRTPKIDKLGSSGI